MIPSFTPVGRHRGNRHENMVNSGGELTFAATCMDGRCGAMKETIGYQGRSRGSSQSRLFVKAQLEAQAI